MNMTLIKNGNLVLPDGIKKADILIKDGLIYKIGENLTKGVTAQIETADAAGKYVFPGFIDMHCHLRDPGQTHKEDIASGAAAAAAGGFTTVCCMPNTTPVIDNAPLVGYVKSRALAAGKAKVLPIGAITKGSLGEELAPLASMASSGAIAFSDDGKPVENGTVFKRALEYADSFNLLLISHPEDKSLSADGVVNEGYNASQAGLKGIPAAAEETAIARDVILAQAAGARLHIAHVSTKIGVEIIRAAKKRGARITAETCPHYFAATDSAILSYNTNAKINPPLRTETDRQAVIEGLKDGTIDVIATDHAPHHADEKNREFDLAPFGTVGLETAFSVCYTYLVKENHIDILQLSKLLSFNPAKLLGLEGVGGIKEGNVADLTVADINKTFTLNAKTLVSKSKNSLFDGFKLTGAIEKVFVNGIEIR
jgi:dihydroorotase